jgi:hypothetical protein
MAAHLILNGKLKTSGSIIPTSKEIYQPVLEKLKEHGIVFHEEHRARSMSL